MPPPPQGSYGTGLSILDMLAIAIAIGRTCGGYTLAADTGHLEFASTIISSTTTAPLAILFPAYDLAPYATYPHQLAQAVESLAFLLQHRRPENVILAGDSAGTFPSLFFPSTHPPPPPLPKTSK
ncbi:MAG: hypothetical protein Q9195_003205 [Heterodermia aff. obscurata]